MLVPYVCLVQDVRQSNFTHFQIQSGLFCSVYLRIHAVFVSFFNIFFVRKRCAFKKYIYIQTAWKQRAAHFAVKCWLYLGWFRCWTVKERGSEALGATRRRGCSPVSRHRALLLLTTSLQCALSLRLLRLGLSPTLSRSLFLSPRSTFVSLPLLFFSFNFVFRDKARVSIMKKYLVLV